MPGGCSLSAWVCRYLRRVAASSLDDRGLPKCRPGVLIVEAQRGPDFVDGILDFVKVAVKGLELGRDLVDRVGRALGVSDDQEIVFGDNLVRQVKLVEQELQAGLESDALEFELDLVVDLQAKPVERRAVDGDRGIEGEAELLRRLVERGRLVERERERLEQGILDRA